MVTLRRNGIELRRPIATDAAAVAAAVRASLPALTPWMPWATPTYDANAARAWIDDREQESFVIIDHDGEPAGSAVST